MRYIIILLLFSFFLIAEGELIETDASDIIEETKRYFTPFSSQRKILSNITNNTNPIQSPPPIYGIFINSIIPKIGIGGMKLRVYSDYFINNEVYFLNICNETEILICMNNCKYLEIILQDRSQGKCEVHLNKNIFNFTFTISTKPIEIKLSLNINLNNQSELNIFTDNFKKSLVKSLDSVKNVDQIFICDTCISEVTSRRLLNIEVRIKFQILALQPVYNNIDIWQNQITSETVLATSLIVNNLEILQNQNIIFLGIQSGNISNNSSIGTINPNYTDDRLKNKGFGEAWEIALISIASYLFIAFIIRYYLYYRNERRRKINNKEIIENKNQIDNEEIVDEDIVVYDV